MNLYFAKCSRKNKSNIKIKWMKRLIFILQWKGHISLIPRSVKKISLYKTSYYSKPNNCDENKTKVELDLSNYATKCDL